ncbi:hypothetical protein F5J12DRAFT_121415 [Pisolithus orientalis]|uniref:NmrA-like domain-containing protein n=1 Tax=Pisolithus tinctorius Marx 270 TaxID=870435 RepID=A0A0C3KCW9_PISTI|nr:uncharacterized protein F5J12DRAFT_121415 [Pisolithus orientalis]KAI6005027.1 hypothetical protein F5J12DRAFT_121415 [Pisolithus orientalis]KAI6153237.1 hypothetical protein BKA82DRAFT_23965 [Pisolithus tinctorius]KIO07457.1 hypothetical protein M404DRAFT_23965 [Pisolithus tinctorius Marx 270]
MSTNTLKSFAVAGVGNTVGLPIVKSLLARNARVIVLTRPSSKKTFPEGAKAVPVDYFNHDALTAALRENAVDVVISTLSGDGFNAQYKLADAAKAAGVKLFVPSEFGMPTSGATEGVLGEKNKLAAYAQSIGLPITRIYDGLYQEFLPFMVGVPEAGKFLIKGSGNEPLSLTAIPDVGEYLAYVLTTLPIEQLSNAELRIQGERSTLRELSKLYDAPVEFVESIPKDIPRADGREWLQAYTAKGAMSTGYDITVGKDDPELAGSANKLFPGFHFKTVKETLAL